MPTAPTQSNNRAFRFDNTYAQLPEGFFARVQPQAVAQPEVLLFNHALAAELGIDTELHAPDEWAALLSGNQPLAGAEPLAQAYAGHQFGHPAMLGDGRALLLGEHLDAQARRFDVQLKGSGRTPYSRRGDGRATLSAMLREYLISEAMQGLGIATSRSLAVVATGEAVQREQVQPGAVLTRIMQSHIRVGTFEYVSASLGLDALSSFLDYVLKRHYPHLLDAPNKALALLQTLMQAQIDLVVEWMRVGFIHGVMNTDNMSIAAQTFDYGPCAFMNAYDPRTVFSSIDANGRYAFGNQPAIVQWNLGVLAMALLPVLHPDKDQAVELARGVLDGFGVLYRQQYRRMMANKLGIEQPSPEDADLTDDLLLWMLQQGADYTNTFRALTDATWTLDARYAHEGFRAWLPRWQARVAQNAGGMEQAQELMRTANPVLVPRNHLVEQALEDATQRSDFALFHELLAAWQQPYLLQPAYTKYREVPADFDAGYLTYCGT